MDRELIYAEGEVLHVPNFARDFERAKRERTSRFFAAVGQAELLAQEAYSQYLLDHPNHNDQFQGLVSIGKTVIEREDVEEVRRQNRSWLEKMRDFLFN